MLDTLTCLRADTANADAETDIRFSELTQAIALNGAVRRSRRKFEAARDAATRTALLSPLMFMAACASGDSGGGGGAQGPSTVAPPPGDTTPDTLAGRPLAIDAAAGLLANVQAPAGVTPQVTTISVANGAAGAVGQPLTSPLGALTVAADGSYTFTPANNATVTALGEGVTATQNFTYTIQSGGTTFQPATLTITITGTNDAPVAAAPAPVAASSSAPVSLGITVPTDPDINANGQPDPLTVSSIVLRQNGTVNASLASAFRILPDGQAPLQGGQETPGTPLSLSNLPAVNQLDNIVFDPANLPAGTYSFEYTVRDSGGRSVRQTVTITLTNDAPVLVADPVAVVEDGTAVTGSVLANDSDPEDRALTVTAVSRGGASQAVVAGSPTVIAGAFGALTLNADGSYSFAVDNALGTVQALGAGQTLTDNFTYTARDTNGGTSTAQIAVTITGVNDAPRFTGNQAFNVQQGRFDVARIAATDIDGDDLSFSIVGGADAGSFFLDDLSGQLSFRGVTSVANPGDADGNNVYDITVGITDGTTTVTRPLSITVSLNGAPEPPVASDTTASITEDAAPNSVSGLLAASDPNNDPLTFSRQGNGAGVYGQLIVNPNGTFTYTLDNGDTDTNSLGAGQTATDLFTYEVDDGTGQPPATAQVRITVTGANDAPVIAATRAVTVNSGTTAVTAAGNGTDPDSNATLTYTIAGADAALFTVDAQTGALAFRAAPNIANPQDQGADNVYNLTLTVTDGSLSAAQAVEITVISDNFPPVFGNEAEIFVDENTVGAITILSVTDADDDPVTFGALGGADAARFQLNTVTGALSFITPPDFEAPTDANGDNIYEATATASDGQATTTQTLLITVGDVVEAPNNNPPVISGITASNFATVDPNNANIFTYDELQAATNPVFLVSATDPDTDALTFGLTGADSALFTIDAIGQVVFNAAPDFEAPQDAGGDNRYEVQVVVSDGAATVTSSLITVVVGDVLENTLPVAANDSFTVIEDDRNPATTDDVSPVTGNVLANDSDTDVTNGVPGQSLRVSAIRTGDLGAGGTPTTVSGPTDIVGQFGVLTIDGPGNASYVLNGDQDSLNTGDTRREVFTYTLVDGAGGTTQAELVYNIEGRTDLLAVDAVDDVFTTLVTRTDFEENGVVPIQGISLSTNDLPSTPSRSVEVIAARFINDQTGSSTTWTINFDAVTGNFQSFSPFDGSLSLLSFDSSRGTWELSLADGIDGLLYDLSRVEWNFRLEYTIGDTDDAFDGLLDADSAATDTATAFITISIDAGSVIPVAEADKTLAAVQGLTTSVALNIAAPTDNAPLPANAITVLSLPTQGDITTGGRILQVGDTLTVAELGSLVWDATGLAPNNYGSFSYSVLDADGNASADRNAGTFEIEAQIVTLAVVQREINLGSFTNGYTITPSTAGGGIGSFTNVDFGAALAVASDTVFGSVEGGGTRDLVIGAPGHSNGAGALFGTDLSGLTTGNGVITGGNRIVTGAAGQRLGTSVAVGPIDGFRNPNNPELIVGAPGANSAAGAVYILSGELTEPPVDGVNDTITTPGNITGTVAIPNSALNGTNVALISGTAGSGLGSTVAYLGNIGGVNSGPELFLNAPGADSFFSFAGNAPGAANNTDGRVAPISVSVTDAGVGYVIDGGSYAGTNPVEGLKNIANPPTTTTGVGYSLGTASAGGFTAASYGTIGQSISNIADIRLDALVLGNSTTNQVVIVGGVGDIATTAQPGVSGDELNAPLVLSTGNAADALGASTALVNALGFVRDQANIIPDSPALRDLLIGAPGRDSTANGTDNVGAAFLLMGGGEVFSLSGSFSLDNTATNARIVEIRNNIAGSGFGTVVADIGDYNGDDIGDFAIGAPGQNGGNGAVYVVFGRAFEDNWFGDVAGQNRTTLVLDASNLGTEYIRLDGTSGARAGAAILGLGDINNDGRDDIAIGAPDGGTNANGIVHVIFGTPIAQVADPRAGAQNGAPPPQFSAAVSVFDADGQVDALLAATLGEGAQAPLDAGVFAPEFDGEFDKAQLLAFAPLHADGMVLHIA